MSKCHADTERDMRALYNCRLVHFLLFKKFSLVRCNSEIRRVSATCQMGVTEMDDYLEN